MSDIQFVNGLIIKPPHEKAPDFVKAAISIKREELLTWLRTQTDEWINIDVKESKGGKWYAAVNDWKPDDNSRQGSPSVATPANAAASGDFDDELPPF